MNPNSSADFFFNGADLFSLEFCFFLIFLLIFFILIHIFPSIWCVLLLYLKIMVNGSLSLTSSRLRNYISQDSAKSFMSLFQDCYSNACYINGYNNCIVLDLFLFICGQILSYLSQAYCISIPSLKFELSNTYNYGYDLSTQFILKTKFMKNKLRWMIMQNIKKMQWKHIIYSLSSIDLSLKVSW